MKLGAYGMSVSGVGFDLGFYNLGLSLNGNLQVQMGVELALGFGVSRSEGFFFDTSLTDELKANITATIPGSELSGGIRTPDRL